MSKAELRARYRESGVTPEVSAAIAAKVAALCQELDRIGLYYPLPGEVDLAPLFRLDKEVYLPTTTGDQLVYRLYTGELVPGALGTQVATGPAIAAEKLQVVIAPGLAFNRKGFRLGRGKGYYDRFFRDFPGLKVGVIADAGFINVDFQEECDVPLDIILTEKRIFIVDREVRNV